MGKGFAFLRQQREAHPSRGDRMMSFWPSPKDIAQFWFATTAEDAFVPLVHGVERKRRDGSTYTADALCQRATYDEPKENCPLCVAGAKGPWYRTCMYVWVDKVYHKFPPPEGKTWKKVQRANSDQALWLEEVNGPRFWMMKDAMAEQVEAAYLGDPDDTDRVPTLFDRPYRVDVTGEGSTRRDILKPLDKKEMPAEVLEGIKALPPIEVTAQDKMGERKPTEATTVVTDDLPFDDSDPGPSEPPVDESELISF